MVNIEVIFAFAVGTIAIAGIGLMTVTAIACLFSPNDMGRFELVQVAVSLDGISSKLGIARAYVREHQEGSDRGALFEARFAIGVAFMLIAMLVSVAFAKQIAEWLFGVVHFERSLGLLEVAYLISLLSVLFIYGQNAWREWIPALSSSAANAISFLASFVVRTEASAYVWRLFPRLRLQILVTMAMWLSIATLGFGPGSRPHAHLIWFVLLPVGAWCFRAEWMGMYRPCYVAVPSKFLSAEPGKGLGAVS
ncbi:hypothetical protein [Dyella sp. Tek66A03]|uniref:hypothetical protein n=1 Tax=Dyella sp. Tek66A03 TaxID=3458298 RepID=UPI00403EEE2C